MQDFAVALVSGKLAQCKKLDLGCNVIGDVGMQALASAIAKGALAQCQELRLNWNRIGDVGMQDLASAIANRAAMVGLTRLDLSRNRIGGVGMQAFAKVLANGALPNLRAQFTAVYNNPASNAARQAVEDAIENRE